MLTMAQWGKQVGAITRYYHMDMLSCFVYEFIYLLCNAVYKGSIKTIENNEREEKLQLLVADMAIFYIGSELI